MKKYICIIMGIFILLLTAVGCSSSADKSLESKSYAVDITDMSGNEIKLEKIPEKIVSLSPTNTELIFSVGAGSKLVGVTEQCDFPEEAKTIEKIGSFSEANLEKIAEIKPDVVFAGGSINENLKTSLEELEIPVVTIDSQNIQDIFKSIELTGKITGCETKSSEVVSKMKADLEQIKQKVEGLEPVSVFYVVWRDPFKTAGKNTFIDEAITLAGGKNIAGNLEGWADYSREELINQNPTGIIASQHFTIEEQTVETLSSDELFMDLDAAKAKKVHIITDDSKISRGGPRLVEAIDEMRIAIESWR